MSCGVGCRQRSDPALLWLWCHRPAATVPIGPLVWEPPYAVGMAQKSQKKKKPLVPNHDFHIGMQYRPGRMVQLISGLQFSQQISCHISPLPII